jgi:hypothetical protein
MFASYAGNEVKKNAIGKHMACMPKTEKENILSPI